MSHLCLLKVSNRDPHPKEDYLTSWEVLGHAIKGCSKYDFFFFSLYCYKYYTGLLLSSINLLQPCMISFYGPDHAKYRITYLLL